MRICWNIRLSTYSLAPAELLYAMHVYVDWVDADHWQVRFFDPIDPVDGFKEVANYRQSQHDDKRKRIKRG